MGKNSYIRTINSKEDNIYVLQKRIINEWKGFNKMENDVSAER